MANETIKQKAVNGQNLRDFRNHIVSALGGKQDKPIDLTGFIYNSSLQPRLPLAEEDARILTAEEQEMWDAILAGVTNKSEFTFFGRLVAFTDYLGMDTSYVHTWEFSTKDSVMEISVRHFMDGEDEKFYLSMPNEPSQYVFSDGLKTINSNSLVGSGDITVNEIASISTVESSVSGGNNVVTITDTNGNETSFSVKNGADGGQIGDVAIVQDTGNRTDAVMSQKVATEYGHKATAEDLAGTSTYIKSKLTELGWIFGYYLKSNDTLGASSKYCVSAYMPMSNFRGHSITFGYMYNNYASAYILWYDANKNRIEYYSTNATNARNVTISDTETMDNVAYFRMTCNPNRLRECYLKDNTTGEYIFKGSDLLDGLNINSNISLNYFRETLLEQGTGTSEITTMSQDAITTAITEEPIRKNKYSNYHVFASTAVCYSVDVYDLDELKVISSRRITEAFAGAPSSYHSNQGHILGIVSAANPSNDYFSLINDSYQVYIRLRKNGVNTDYALGNYYFNNNKVQRLFTQIDFYGKKLSLYAKNTSGNIITLVDRYDFSALDFSNLQKVKIATSVGSSHNNALVNNLIRINVYTAVPADQLNAAIKFGEYNNVASTKFITKPATPSTYMFTNESATAGITVTLNDPLHKIVEVDRDTVGLVYNWGFYTFGNSPISSNAYEICKLTFTNVESNLLIKGWSENGGHNYIVDENYVFTQIPMNTNTGTVLDYPIEEGKTYYLIYALGSGYSTRYNHYIGGHFTMEITEPTTYTVGAQNLCAEIFDGKYFVGHIPFVASGNPVPSFYGQFGTNNYPAMTGRFRISSGNVYVHNGSVWKQINNS